MPQEFDLPVPLYLVGDNAPSVSPGADPDLFGHAHLSPTEPVDVRSHQSFTLTYTVGSLGIDDTGGIRIAWRTVGDTGRLQMTDPKAANFVTAESNGQGRLDLSYARMGGQRPWGEILTITQRGGYLKSGEVITIRIGDQRQGSPGLLIQTFTEAGRDFKVMADVQATGNFTPLPNIQLTVPVVAGPPVAWKAVTASKRRIGEAFFLGIKTEDAWGNPAVSPAGEITIRADQKVNNLPETLTFDGNTQTLTLENLSADQAGFITFSLIRDDQVIATAGPVSIEDSEYGGYWGDLHGQSGETIGIGRIEDYMNFARNKAFLDVTCHQGNDFQIRDVFWAHLNTISADWNEPDRFTVFPGYEWSGNTAVGGDHNVIYSQEGGALFRCSHALIEDRHDLEKDANTLTDLYQKIHDSGHDTVIFAHIGGRYADINYDHDPILETAVEIHSDWGTFEWIASDSFALGRRIGIVANSDGHKGRPGASYPGISEFGAYGGLTCFLAKSNTREDLFEAMRRRRHYATTGCRIVMDVTASLSQSAIVYPQDPKATNTGAKSQTAAMMGDIVATDANHALIQCHVRYAVGIERIELRDGTRVLKQFRPYDDQSLGKRLRLTWSGAEYRGRGRNTLWQGQARVKGATISKVTPLNRWNPERKFEHDAHELTWESVTTGNFMGADLWLDDDQAEIMITTNHGDLNVPLYDLGLDPVVLDCGGLERQLTATRLPDDTLECSLIFHHRVELSKGRDHPIWICVVTEDGHKAWSSPIYFIDPIDQD